MDKEKTNVRSGYTLIHIVLWRIAGTEHYRDPSSVFLSYQCLVTSEDQNPTTAPQEMLQNKLHVVLLSLGCEPFLLLSSDISPSINSIDAERLLFND